MPLLIPFPQIIQFADREPGWLFDSAKWHYPGSYFTGTTRSIKTGTAGIIAPPVRISLDTGIGGNACQMQLVAWSGSEPVHNANPDVLSSFRIINQHDIPAAGSGINHDNYDLTESEIAALMAIPYKYFLTMQVRFKSYGVSRYYGCVMTSANQT